MTGNISTILYNITNNRHLVLKNIDMSGVNISHNITLRGSLVLDNIRGNIGSLLETVKCNVLGLSNMTLDSETTRSLVHCARENVKKKILLGHRGLLTLDIDVFTGYNGDGTCWGIYCYHKTKEKYGDRMITWAQHIGLEVVSVSDYIRIFRR